VPLVAVVLALIVLVALLVLSLPFSIIQRYRMGTSRRLARGWVVTINFFGIVVSVGILLVVALVSTAWIPRAFPYTVVGLMGGCVLGFLGLVLSRWEPSSQALHYTPNRWLVLSITLVVAARLVYGFWRGWETWRSTPDGTSWLAASGAAGSMAAGAVVLGYYLVYWAGVRRRLKQHGRTVTILAPK
jgi:hypothetical protein